eukprot:1383346-Rhodomonas_salina.5
MSDAPSHTGVGSTMSDGPHAAVGSLMSGVALTLALAHAQFGVDLDVKGTTSQQKLIANMLAQSLAMATGQLLVPSAKLFPPTFSLPRFFAPIFSLSPLTDLLTLTSH